MTTPDPRDRAIDAALRRTAAAPGPASAECLDAETLAAWADRELEPADMQRAEAHMADCARCQAVMATLVSSLEGAPADEASAASPARAWWSFDLRWLVPLAGAAAAVLLWVVVPDRGPDRMAHLDAPTLPSDRLQAPSQQLATPVPAPTGGSPAGVVGAGQRADVPARPPRTGEPPAPREAPRTETASAIEARPAPARPAGEADAVARANERADLQLADAVRQKDERMTAAGARAESAPPAAVAAPAALPEPAALGKTLGASAAENRRARQSANITSRDPATAWRVAGAGVVERSTDGGATWTSLDTGVRADDVTAGSAPAATVCWLVGPNGLVLLTTDARTWRRLPGPSVDDLIGIEATSATAAVVRSRGGVAFRTTDAGATWISVP